MLLPMPGVVPSAPGEMICRLEPESLRYLDLSKNLQEFLRLPPGEFLHQSLLQHLHQDDRDLAEEESARFVSMASAMIWCSESREWRNPGIL